MAREFKRTDRVAEQLQRELAVIIQTQVKDSRLGMATVSSVDISADLYHATVFMTFLGIGDDSKSIQQALEVLNQSSGYIRGLLAKQIKMRVMPEIKFEFDGSIAQGNHMSQLIKQARRKDADTDSESSSSESKD